MGILEKEDEPTLIVLLDAVTLPSAETDYYALCRTALDQCHKLGDRFLLVDIPDSSPDKFPDNFRSSNTFGNNYLSYAAAYHPYLSTTLNYVYDEVHVTINDLSSQSEKSKGAVKSTFTWSSGNQGITVSYTGSAGDVPKVIFMVCGNRVPWLVPHRNRLISSVLVWGKP